VVVFRAAGVLEALGDGHEASLGGRVALIVTAHDARFVLAVVCLQAVEDLGAGESAAATAILGAVGCRFAGFALAVAAHRPAAATVSRTVVLVLTGFALAVAAHRPTAGAVGRTIVLVFTGLALAVATHCRRGAAEAGRYLGRTSLLNARGVARTARILLADHERFQLGLGFRSALVSAAGDAGVVGLCAVVQAVVDG